MELNLTAAMTEELGERSPETVTLSYYHLKSSGEKEIKTSEGDLTMIVNVLMDYADIWEEYLKQERERLGAYQAAAIPVCVERYRRVAKELQEKIGYDRERAMERCQKKRKKAANDIGEEALVLAAKRGRRKEPERPKEKTKAKEPEPVEKQINMLDLL